VRGGRGGRREREREREKRVFKKQLAPVKVSVRARGRFCLEIRV
jgi:hypothetical protein